MTQTPDPTAPPSPPAPSYRVWRCDCGEVLGYIMQVDSRVTVMVMSDCGPLFTPYIEALFCAICGKANSFQRREREAEWHYAALERRYRGNRPG